jgi:Predicted nucleotidyltransferases
MVRLASSDNALAALLLVSQRPEGLRISTVAELLGISYTGAQKALEILAADELVARHDHRNRLVDSPLAHEAIRFSLAFLDQDRGLSALARANPAVEFCGLDDRGMLVVIRRFAEPADEMRLHEAVDLLAGFHPTRKIEFANKDDLRDQLLEDVAPRHRAARMRILAGSVDRTFPDRTRHGDFDAPRLGELNPMLATPSRRRLRDLARRYGLQRILAFGSATRADFRQDSDVDLLVEPAPGHHLDLDDRIGLTVEAERLFGRDVDLLTAPIRRPSLAERVRRDGVVLYEAT